MKPDGRNTKQMARETPQNVLFGIFGFPEKFLNNIYEILSIKIPSRRPN
jgi:hypothetical protein